MNNDQVLEQVQATFRDISPILFTYFTKLMIQGFSQAEAMQLVVALQTSILFPQH